MKTVEEYMKLPYKIEIIPDLDEGGYVLRYPELPGCLSTGETIDDAIKNGKDAQRAWLKAAIEDGITIKEPEALIKYSGQFKLRIPKDLHRQLAENAKRAGISMNQYCVYLLSKNI